MLFVRPPRRISKLRVKIETLLFAARVLATAMRAALELLLFCIGWVLAD